jgi:TniQ
MMDILQHKLCEQSGYWQGDIRTFKGKSCYISMGELTRGLVPVLHEFTGRNDLAGCTMIPLQQVIASKGLLADDDRHCPLCIGGDEHSYGRLIWDLACVNACHIHGIHLVPSTCEAPAEKQLPLSRRKTIYGVCSTCGSIGYRCRKQPPQTASPDDLWKAQQAGELLSFLPEAQELFSRERTVQGLKSLVEMFAEGKAAVAARHAGMNKSVLWGWVNGNYLPSLGLLLDLCLATGVSLVSVMQGQPVTCASHGILIRQNSDRAQKATALEREESLRRALEGYPPVSLGAVANDLELGARSLRYQFPDLAAQVVERYREFESLRKAERAREQYQLGQSLLRELAVKGLPLTQRNFQELYGKPLMPASRIYQVYKNARAEQMSHPG